ncbi:hypothetical protein SLEP1_g52770 [Rubroshorea leprosula]|uniref:Uncharacterized protein n=1 Tax=Rubroshorea leprosula TaxID=152421 RepID=A0AAV5M9K1_9ROSI|nr:hypothetical protein SLEP1_g52770 [Rubroshorea leprosula]
MQITTKFVVKKEQAHHQMNLIFFWLDKTCAIEFEKREHGWFS